MHDDRAIPSTDDPGAGAWWRAAAVLAWVGGVALQLQQPILWASEAYPLMAAAALGALLLAMRTRWRVGLCIALAAAGFA